MFKTNKIIRFYSKEAKRKWKSVVGLEVHAQIAAESKLFSGASTEFSSPVNNNVAFFDCAIPGTLPVLNKRCVEAGVKTALALNCTVNPVSMFDRKHYFYADLPSGYQITQQRSPLAVNGQIDFQVFNPSFHKNAYQSQVKIKQLQLEQDSGKSLHDTDRSLVDLNRAGVGLMEVVFEPDLKDGEEAAALVKELSMIFQRIGTCSCKMEEGALRIDANVSIHKEWEPLGVRTEIKNIGSIRGVAGAVQYEIERQIKLKERGENVINETRSWNAETKTTVPMRDKEEKQDYRYMPEPNLPPLHVAMGYINQGVVNADELKSLLPELPYESRRRLHEEIGLTPEQSIILVNDECLYEIFTKVIKFVKDAKLLANILINDFTSAIHKADYDTKNFINSSEFVKEAVVLLESEKINRNTIRLLFNDLINGLQLSANEIVRQKGLMQVTDEAILEKLCEEVMRENQKAVDQYHSGKTKVFKALIGAVANKSQQRADMVKCNVILKKLLNKK